MRFVLPKILIDINRIDITLLPKFLTFKYQLRLKSALKKRIKNICFKDKYTK